MSDSTNVTAYSEPPRESNPYADGWKQGVIAMETWTLEQGLDRRSVHQVAVQIMHQAVTQEERRATKYGEYQPDDILDPKKALPDGVEVTVVDPETVGGTVEGDDSSVDVLALAQEDMAAAESRTEPDLPGIETELSALLNRYSAESVSGTPDFILAKFLIEVLKSYNEAVSTRAEWRGEFADFNPSRNVHYTDGFTGKPIPFAENPDS